MRTSPWAWPVFESLHFIGMSVLIGTVGLFDLRLLNELLEADEADGAEPVSAGGLGEE